MSSIEGCVPDVYVDGARIPAWDGGDIDQLVSVAEIAAVEVYPGIYKPPEYDSGNLCGSIVIWTGLSPGEAAPAGSHGFDLKTLAAGLAAFAAVAGVIALAWH